MSASSRQLNIITWNAQSVTSKEKIIELEILLRERDIHVVCIQETYLNRANKFYLPNFTIYRNDRATHGGGVAIAIRKEITHYPLRSKGTVTIENIAIAIRFNNKLINIYSAYCPHYSNNFERDLTAMTTTTSECIIFGDLNAKHTTWGCAKNNSAGNALLNHLNTSDFLLLAPRSHTHHPHSGATPSTIDILLTNLSEHVGTPVTLNHQLSSDHFPVLTRINGGYEVTRRIQYQYFRANWQEFQHHIIDEDFNPPLNTTHEVDSSIVSLTRMLTEARDAAIPTTIRRDTATRIATDTLRAIKYKNKLVRNWQRCTDATIKNSYKTAVNIAGRLIKELVRRDRNANWSSLLERLEPDSKRFWRITKSLRGGNTFMPSKLRHEGGLFYTDTEKADALATMFERAHSITLNDVHPQDATVSGFIDRFDRLTDFDYVPFTIAELSRAIDALKPFKAPGDDNMFNVLLKHMPDNTRSTLCDIYNACLSMNFWPTSFKTAKVIPIPKPGRDREELTGYRPISLLNNLGKLFERMIHERLTNFVNENDVLNAEQFGFRSQHSTSHQVLRVTNHIRRNRGARKSTGMVLFDIEKAFDSVWHDGLVYKLSRLGFPTYLSKMIQNFMADRTFTVHVGGARSTARRIPAGLPQGSVLSPTLYSIFVSDLRLDRFTHTACYADDTAMYVSANRTATICKRLQRSLTVVERYYSRWKIRINPTKTQAILFPFNGQRKRLPRDTLTLGGVPINFTNTVKYLGVTLDRKLLFREHVNQMRIGATRRMATLYPLIGRRSTLADRSKMLIFKTVIRPTLTYASPVWITAAVSNRKHLQIIQNKCLKMILRLPWRYHTNELHERAEMPTLHEYVGTLNEKFKLRCANSDFELIRELAE